MNKYLVASVVFLIGLLSLAAGGQQATTNENKKSVAAPKPVLLDGERVKPDEAMIFTRSVLIETGSAVASMSYHQDNIATVRHNINTYRIGYSLMSKKVGDRYVFVGPAKCWRATSTGDVSVWPSAEYPASRNETIRRAMLLEPITLFEPVSEMSNLRVYYFPTLIGYNGRQYQVQPVAIAFFIHPTTGNRMTVISRAGRTYGAVNRPVASTSKIYVADTAEYSGGPFNLFTIHVPAVFYSKEVTFDMEPFAEGHVFEKLMDPVLSAHEHGPLSTEDFKALYREMLRYTGGIID